MYMNVLLWYLLTLNWLLSYNQRQNTLASLEFVLKEISWWPTSASVYFAGKYYPPRLLICDMDLITLNPRSHDTLSCWWAIMPTYISRLLNFKKVGGPMQPMSLSTASFGAIMIAYTFRASPWPFINDTLPLWCVEDQSAPAFSMLYAPIKHSFEYLSVFSCYAPTDKRESDDALYDQLRDEIRRGQCSGFHEPRTSLLALEGLD